MRRAISFALIVLLWPLLARAAEASLVLIPPELTIIRAVLERDPSGSGLDKLSDVGKKVLRNPANAAVVLHQNAQWGYRLIGNNRQLFFEQGDGGDFACVASALESKPFRFLSYNGKGLEPLTAANLHLALANPLTRDTTVAHLRALASDSNVAAPVKDYVLSEIGAVLAALPKADVTALTSADDSSIFAQAIAHNRAEDAVLDQLRRTAKATSGAELRELLAELQKQSSADAPLASSLAWKTHAFKDQKVHRAQLGDGELVLLLTTGSDKETPWSYFETAKGLEKLRSGEAKLYLQKEPEKNAPLFTWDGKAIPLVPAG